MVDVELIEIRDFLAAYHPFDLLPPDVLASLPAKMESSYARRDTVVAEPGQQIDFLYIVRTGSVETHSPDGQLLARLSTGEAFGIHALLAGGKAINKVIALEDSLFYMLPASEFERLRRDYQQFAYFFAPLGAARLRSAKAHGAASSDEQLNLMSFRTRDLLSRAPVSIGNHATIREAAKMMKDNRVSCLLITEGDHLHGIVTDRDLRNRVVADGLDVNAPVTSIMTPDPVSLEADSYAFDALLTMTRRNIRHLPIVDQGKIAGVITNTNLVQKQTTSAVYLVGDIYKRDNPADMADVVAKIPRVLLHLVEAGATAHNIGHIITSIADAATSRLLVLAEEKLGPPPVPYLWLACGSQARHEQTGVSDQDNFMIMDDAYDPARHGEYFDALSKLVCDGLNTCGYVYCPGEMMAMNPQWRLPLKAWRNLFSKWIEVPEPKALMLSSVFFDLRPVRGELGLYHDLHAMILNKTQVNKLFLGHLIGNALHHTPPLGFFKNFVLIRDGEHNRSFDLKHSGVVPIVDIARIRALAGGIEAVNTHDRLWAETDSKILSSSGAHDLQDAYEFIAITRLKHQAEQIRQGEKPDNFMDPDRLSHFERNHLKDAFSVVKTIQSALGAAFPS